MTPDAAAQPGIVPDGDGDALEAAVGRLARIGSCRGPSLAPDGQHVAFVADLTGIPQVWTVPAAGGFPTQVTALDDQVGAVAWSPAGDWLAFTLAPGGGMNEQIYLVRPDGHIAYRAAGSDLTGLRRYLTTWLTPNR